MKKRKIDDNQLLEMLKQGKMQKVLAQHFGVSPAAVCKRLKRLLPQPESVLEKYNLTDQQKQFVLEKAKGKTNTQAALASYEVNSMQSAKVIGSQLMDKPEIEMAINELMAEAGLTKRYRFRKVRQHIDHPDPNVSLRGLDMSFKLDGSYAPKQLNVNIDPEATSAEIAELEAQVAEWEAREGRTIDVTPEQLEAALEDED
jgi:hypothetical protein